MRDQRTADLREVLTLAMAEALIRSDIDSTERQSLLHMCDVLDDAVPDVAHEAVNYMMAARLDEDRGPYATLLAAAGLATSDLPRDRDERRQEL